MIAGGRDHLPSSRASLLQSRFRRAPVHTEHTGDAIMLRVLDTLHCGRVAASQQPQCSYSTGSQRLPFAWPTAWRLGLWSTAGVCCVVAAPYVSDVLERFLMRRAAGEASQEGESALDRVMNPVAACTAWLASAGAVTEAVSIRPSQVRLGSAPSFVYARTLLKSFTINSTCGPDAPSSLASFPMACGVPPYRLSRLALTRARARGHTGCRGCRLGPVCQRAHRPGNAPAVVAAPAAVDAAAGHGPAQRRGCHLPLARHHHCRHHRALPDAGRRIWSGT